MFGHTVSGSMWIKTTRKPKGTTTPFSRENQSFLYHKLTLPDSHVTDITFKNINLKAPILTNILEALRKNDSVKMIEFNNCTFPPSFDVSAIIKEFPHIHFKISPLNNHHPENDNNNANAVNTDQIHREALQKNVDEADLLNSNLEITQAASKTNLALDAFLKIQFKFKSDYELIASAFNSISDMDIYNTIYQVFFSTQPSSSLIEKNLQATLEKLENIKYKQERLAFISLMEFSLESHISDEFPPTFIKQYLGDTINNKLFTENLTSLKDTHELLKDYNTDGSLAREMRQLKTNMQKMEENFNRRLKQLEEQINKMQAQNSTPQPKSQRFL